MGTLALITPTSDREDYLKFLYKGLLKQSFQDWNWYIADSSPFPSAFFQKHQDPRLHYTFLDEPSSVGQKRNFLVDQAKESWIVHIDDDDYYAPTYLKYLSKQLETCEFFLFSSWFAHDVKTHQSFYFETQKSQALRFICEPVTGPKLMELKITSHTNPELKQKLMNRQFLGYGFCFAYHKAVWQSHPFANLNSQEDWFFLEAAKSRGINLQLDADNKGHLVKIIHDQNLSSIFPQYRIPSFLMETYHPGFLSLIQEQYPQGQSFQINPL
jgi:hypothetical protein